MRNSSHQAKHFDLFRRNHVMGKQLSLHSLLRYPALVLTYSTFQFISDRRETRSAAPGRGVQRTTRACQTVDLFSFIHNGHRVPSRLYRSIFWTLPSPP